MAKYTKLESGDNIVTEVIDDVFSATTKLIEIPVEVIEDVVPGTNKPFNKVNYNDKLYAVNTPGAMQERTHSLVLVGVLVLWWASVATIAGVFGSHYINGPATPYFVSTTDFLTSIDDDDHVAPNNCVGGLYTNPCPPNYHIMQAFAWPFAMGLTFCAFAAIFIAIWLFVLVYRMVTKSPYILPAETRSRMTTWDVIDHYTFKVYRDAVVHDHHMLLSHVFSCITGLFLHFIIALTIGEGIGSIYIAVLTAFIFFASEIAGLFMVWENRRKDPTTVGIVGTHIRPISFPAWVIRIGLWAIVIVIEMIFFTRYPAHARQTDMYIMFIFELVLSFLQAGGLQGLYYLHLSPVLRTMDPFNRWDVAYLKRYYKPLLTNPDYTVVSKRYEFRWTLNPMIYEYANHFFNLLRVTIVIWAFWGLTNDHTYIPLLKSDFPL